MAIIANKPFILTDVILEIDGHDFGAAVNSVVFTPTAGTVTFKGLKPSAVSTFVTPATWVMGLNFAQDWETSGSLAQYLHANEGEEAEVTLKPQSGSGPSFTADIIITPGAIGGTGDQVPTSAVNLGVQGKPTLVPAA